ncbi:MAG TPA: VOC family protein [Ruminiclostridium sp.]
MKLIGIDHITINCCKLEASFQFYKEVLNLKYLNKVDLGDHVLHYFQMPNVKLELIEYKNPQRILQTNNTDTGIYRHFALCVDDLEEVKERCLMGEYKINLEPTYIPEIDKTVMLIVDPNGVEIEVIQA